MNGDAVEKNERSSPEVNSQEQMAAQRASGGDIAAPEVGKLKFKVFHGNYFMVNFVCLFCKKKNN